MSTDLDLVFTTRKQPAPVTFGHQSAAILAGKSTVPEWCLSMPTLPLLSMQSAGDPCPDKRESYFSKGRKTQDIIFCRWGWSPLLSQ